MKKYHQKNQQKILIVDGYNVINAWQDLKELSKIDMEDSRELLNNIISEYSSFLGLYAIIVYDAYKVKESTKEIKKHKNLKIVYTKEKETADTYIEKLVTKLGNKRYLEFLVVTDDIPIQQIIVGKGGSRISTLQLKVAIDAQNKKMRKIIKTNNTGKLNNLMDLIDENSRKKLDTLRKSK